MFYAEIGPVLPSTNPFVLVKKQQECFKNKALNMHFILLTVTQCLKHSTFPLRCSYQRI